MSIALSADRAMDVNVDVFGQGMGFWHDAFLKEAGAQHSLSPVYACEVDSGDGTTLNFRGPLRCSILIGFWRELAAAECHLSGIVGILRQFDGRRAIKKSPHRNGRPMQG
jgi:hypothetical protein